MVAARSRYLSDPVLWRALRLAMVVGVLVPASAWAGVKATPVGAVGDFNAPTYMAAPPGDTHRLFVVQQGGQIALVKDGSCSPQPVPRHLERSPLRRAASRGCCRWRSRPTTPPATGSTSTTPTRTAPVRRAATSTSASSPPIPAATPPRRHPSTCCSRSRIPARTTTTAASSSSGRTATCTSRWATAAAAMTPSSTPRTPTTLLGKLLRISPGTDVLLDPRRQSVQRRFGVLERHQRRLQLSRDLGLRPAQPLALLVRQCHRGPRHRRRRPEPRRGDRLRSPRPERRRRLRLALLRGLRAQRQPARGGVQPVAGARRRSGAELSPQLRQAGVLRRRNHRRLRDARSDAAVAQRLLRVRRPQHPRPPGRRPRPADGGRPGRARVRRSPICRRSGSMQAATCTPPTSAAAPSIASTQTATPPPTRRARR